MKRMGRWALLCSGKVSIRGLSGLGELSAPIYVAHERINLYTFKLYQYVSVDRGPLTFLSRQISSCNSIMESDGWPEAAGSRALEKFNYTRTRSFGSSAENEPFLSREWLMKLWLAEKRRPTMMRIKERKVVGRSRSSENVDSDVGFFHMPSSRWFGGAPAVGKIPNPVDNPYVQPPISQPATGSLKPKSPEEVKLAPLLARANLLVTRDIEWANLMLGFEQENRYAIVDPFYSQSPVGSIREKSNVIFRQLLRGRRPLIAFVTDGMGNELFRVRRPFWFINSSIYVEVDGKEIGVVHRRWHLWRRIYDLYLGSEQFAVVENPGFWNWTFTLKDGDDNVLAEINRDWRGFGFELFTDAGQYVIRFGNIGAASVSGPLSEVEELVVSRQLTLSERAIALALAVSLDNDYFSRHGGWGLPFIAIEE